MDYGDLKALIQDTLQRSDIAPAVPAWIQMAEARFNREIRSRKQLHRSYATLQESFIELPEDWLEARNVELYTDPPRPLELVTLQEADKIRARGETVARFYAIHGSELEVVPHLDEPVEVEMTYYTRIPALSDDRPRNWLLDAWPDLYLYGSLLHSAAYLEQDVRVPQWEAAVQRFLEEIRLADARAQHSGSPLRIRFRSFAC